MTSGRPTRILVVDDESEIREQICELFTLFGYTTQGAENGEQAWKALQSSSYDVVISDIRMPVMSGVELLQKIRAQDKANPKVLIISGFSDVSEKELFNMGANGFLAKPFEASTIRNVLSKLL